MLLSMSFWKHLPKPFMMLAPMADVTDPAFRRLIAEIHSPDVLWTEFVSADGLFHTREKKGMQDQENPLVRDLAFTSTEHPIVAQFFSSNPESMAYAVQYACEAGFDGIDINMGCPDQSIEKQGAGAGHMKNPERAKEVIRAAVKAAAGKPVSVKTRLGYNAIEYREWLPHVLNEDISALTLHMRTRKEMSKVAAHWELAKEIVAFCRSVRPDIVISGNGDLMSIAEAKEKALAFGFDGMMLGRAIFGNPWLFAGRNPEEISKEERLQALLTLAKYFSELTPSKHFAILKKHFKAFVQGFPEAAALRAALMETNTYEDMKAIIETEGRLV